LNCVTANDNIRSREQTLKKTQEMYDSLWWKTSMKARELKTSGLQIRNLLFPSLCQSVIRETGVSVSEKTFTSSSG